MLPKYDVPKYNCVLPGSGRSISFRPFLVKEQKLLLQANNSGVENANLVFNTIYDIILDCTFHKVDLDQLPIYDIDYLFLQIRAKSSGESIPVRYLCKNLVNGEVCDTPVLIQLNLDDLKIKKTTDWVDEKIIVIDAKNHFGVSLKTPNFLTLKHILEDFPANSQEFLDTLTLKVINKIFTESVVYESEKDFNQTELEEYLNTLPGWIIPEIQEFINNIPYVYLDLNIKCPKCSNQDHIELRSLESFLT